MMIELVNIQRIVSEIRVVHLYDSNIPLRMTIFLSISEERQDRTGREFDSNADLKNSFVIRIRFNLS